MGPIRQRLMRGRKKPPVRRRPVSEMTGAVEYDEFWVSKSKPILDEIDRALAGHYGFTEEESDFIINYDIKYRMGGEGGRGERRVKRDPSPEASCKKRG
jgi:hypothetical protein